jgi:amphi-Trp domain-containing protein
VSKKKVSTRISLDPGQLAAQLRALATSFENSKVVITHNDSFVSMIPASVITMELEAESKKGKSKLSLELSWQDALPIAAGTPLLISSEEPERKRREDDGDDHESEDNDEQSKDDR